MNNCKTFLTDICVQLVWFSSSMCIRKNIKSYYTIRCRFQKPITRGPQMWFGPDKGLKRLPWTLSLNIPLEFRLSFYRHWHYIWLVSGAHHIYTDHWGDVHKWSTVTINSLRGYTTINRMIWRDARRRSAAAALGASGDRVAPRPAFPSRLASPRENPLPPCPASRTPPSRAHAPHCSARP